MYVLEILFLDVISSFNPTRTHTERVAQLNFLYGESSKRWRKELKIRTIKMIEIKLNGFFFLFFSFVRLQFHYWQNEIAEFYVVHWLLLLFDCRFILLPWLMCVGRWPNNENMFIGSKEYHSRFLECGTLWMV